MVWLSIKKITLKNTFTMEKNLSKATKIGKWIATLLLGSTRERVVRIDERLSSFMVEMTEFKAETKTELKEIENVLKGNGELLAVHTTMLSSHAEAITGLKTRTGTKDDYHKEHPLPPRPVK